MAIVKMSNFNLFAFDSNKDNLLHGLQKFEYVHFTNLGEDEELKEEGLTNVTVPESILEVEEEISKTRQGINILLKYHVGQTGIKALIEGKPNFTFKELEDKALNTDCAPILEELSKLSSEANRLGEEEKKLNALKEELEHWVELESPIKDIRSLKQSKVFLGSLPKKIEKKLKEDIVDLKYSYVKTTSEDDENVYIFALTSKDESDELYEILKSNSFSIIDLKGEETPKEEIRLIDEKLESTAEAKEKVESYIKDRTNHLQELKVVYEYLMNKKLRLSASENFLATESINMIQGYIPMDMESDFIEAIESSNPDAYYLETKEAEKDDPDVPVLLKNSKAGKAFESLTTMYAVPRYNELDPTPLMAPFYLGFFGMMAGDIAYGLIMLAVTTFALKKANLDESKKQFVKFFFYLSFSVIAFGVLYGSFFGDLIPIKGLINPAEDYQGIMIAAIILGAIHLFFGIGICGYMRIRDGRYLDALAESGVWFMSLIGAIVFGLTMFFPVSDMLNTGAKWLMIAGLAGIVITGGRNAKSVGGKVAVGMYELYGISGYIGDFVSYTRLMALGLSSGFIAAAVNMIARMLFETGVLGIVFGIVVIVFGQSLNIFLTLLGAYVHSARLIYVEFFGKFYEGGGKKFNIFRNKSEFINLKCWEEM